MSATLTSGTYPRRHSNIAPSGWAQRVWQALMAVGRRRATAHLALLAVQYQHSNPELAQQLRNAARDTFNG